MSEGINTMLKALVVDDNEVNIMVLTNMLELLGLSTNQANLGLKAVAMSKITLYDIIFIDHYMPKMDGVQTTATIRDLSPDKQKPIIIALTSNITPTIRSLYQEAGANDLYTKPLGLLELIALLEQWFPTISLNVVPSMSEMPASSNKNEFIKIIISEIEEIDYFTGLKYAIGNPIQSIHILEMSLKQILEFYNIMKDYKKNNSNRELQIVVHNLKSVFTNMGAMGLSKEAGKFEKIILQEDINKINQQCSYMINHLEYFIKRLQATLDQYYAFVKAEKKERELVCIPMLNEEYEQSLLNAIYYINRFEYEAIIKELESLIQRGRLDLKIEFELAYMDIKEFNYEKALLRLTNIKNKIGN